MFGFPRMMELCREHPGGKELIDYLLGQLAEFTGPGWEQEDDVTLVTLQRSEGSGLSMIATASPTSPDMPDGQGNGGEGEAWESLGKWSVPSEPGNERQAMEYVAEAVAPLHLSPRRLEQLKTAVAEATMNAMEHGNHYQADVPVTVEALASARSVAVRITDRGGSRPIPEAHTPDLEAKLAGLQSPRGWGLFLIKNLVDDMRITSDEVHHTVELIVRREGDEHASEES
jgi:anti-sigma regulatory factor (Ser/Thr protein kinase)